MRQVESNVPVNQITDTIRVFAEAYNSAAIDEERQMGTFIERYPIAVTSATTTVTATGANIDGEGRLGMAIRNLTRARMFAINELKYEPPQVTFKFDETAARTHYIAEQTIVFKSFAVPEVMYHEYGHFVMWSKQADPVQYDSRDFEEHDWSDIEGGRGTSSRPGNPIARSA